MATKIIWDGAVWADILRGPDGMLARFMMAAQNQCKENGHMAEYINMRFSEGTGGIDAHIVCAHPAAIYVHNGTRPHDIPNAFGWGPKFGIGGRFDGKFHPGNRANPFLTDNLRLFFT
jgi:hypothetical protein